MEKLIVHFKELPVFPYNMDYLTYCKSCKSYNLGNKACIQCGRDEEISLDKMASIVVARQFMIRELIVIVLYIGLLILASSPLQIIAGTLLTGVCILLNFIIYKKYKSTYEMKEIDRYIHINLDKIKSDLSRQMSMAIQDIEENRAVEAYDRFRYLAKLIDNDEVRTYKLICLRNFKLRSDMPLELKELLQQEWNDYLIDYIYEVSKLRKELIDDATLNYVMQYKEQVLEKHKGRKIIGSVLAGALKSKFLLAKYAEEMPGYLSCFSKDRLLRLCKMSGCIKDKMLREKLLEEVKEIIGEDEYFI